MSLQFTIGPHVATRGCQVAMGPQPGSTVVGLGARWMVLTVEPPRDIPLHVPRSVGPDEELVLFYLESQDGGRL